MFGLIKPSCIQVNESESNQNKATLVAEPIEKGFGVTLGNVLRRILLSSVGGVAVCSIRMPGVLHEFSSIHAVKESVSEIIINIKSLVITAQKLGANEKRKMHLKVQGPCIVTAGMISCDDDIEIINSDLIICTINEGGYISIEMTINKGKGYVPVVRTNKRDVVIQQQSYGVIHIDACYSPIVKVSYDVESSRVGNITNYDKLNLIVETNGSIAPIDAVSMAANILCDQAESFIKFKPEDNQDDKDDFEDIGYNPNLLRLVSCMEFSVRCQNCLRNENIVYIADLVQRTENDMLRTANFGRKSLNEIKVVLKSMGLKFGMKIDNWPPENIQELSKKYNS